MQRFLFHRLIHTQSYKKKLCNDHFKIPLTHNLTVYNIPFACSVSGPLDVIDVDWSSLMPKQKQEPRTPGAALLRFTPGAVLLRAGVSRRLAGPQLLARVKEVCSRELEDPKGECANIPLNECINEALLIAYVFENTFCGNQL